MDSLADQPNVLEFFSILPTGDLGLVWASDTVVVAHYS